MEPRSIWKGVLGLYIKAIDDQGQSLMNLTTLDLPENLKQRNTSTIEINSVPITGKSNVYEGIPGPIALRLRKGEKPAKTLAEVSGTLVALVQTPHETLVRMDDTSESDRKDGEDPAGWLCKSCRGRTQGWRGATETARRRRRRRAGRSAQPPINVTVIINGEEIGKKNHLSAKSFTLQDDKGKPFTIAKATDTGVRVGQASEVELVFRADGKQGTPASFLYQGRRTALVEVISTLKNVRLP